MNEALTAAASRVADVAIRIREQPSWERGPAYREVLSTEVHDPVRAIAAQDDDSALAALARLAAQVRALIPVGPEDQLPPRVRVFIRLLRHDALEAAWTLARDNASGVVAATNARATLAGGSYLRGELPLPVEIVDQRVYAWLPGYTDPRCELPDRIFDVTGDVTPRVTLDRATPSGGGVVELAGLAYLPWLDTGAHDRVAVLFVAPSGRQVRIEAHRARRVDLAGQRDPDLARSAWPGWYARVDLAELADDSGRWAARLQLEHAGLHRSAPLGIAHGWLVAPGLAALPTDTVTGRSIVARLSGRHGLVVDVCETLSPAPA